MDNDEYMRKFFAEHDPEYLEELEPSECGRKKSSTNDSEDKGDSLLWKVGKGLFGILKSAGEQAKRQQRREMRSDCDRMGRLEKTMDEDFDQLQRDLDRDFDKLDKW